MKCLLILLLSLNSQAAPAPDATGTVAATGTATSTATGTATSTATATESYADKFGKNWSSTKQNEDLLKDKAMVDEASKDGNLSQEDAYIMTSNTLFRCVEVAAGGREDDICKTDANHPECVGVAGALKNATNCLEYFTPATLGCKKYGTSDYNLEEWIAVGDQFQTQMVACAEKRNNFDADKKNGKLESLTEMIGASNYLEKLAGGPTMKDTPFNVDSKVSGSIKSDLNLSSVDWDSLASRIKDGASYLGYQDGDIVRASLKGESFSSIVTESPFAQKLNYENRAKLDEGLADSKLISQRVVQSHREKTGIEPLAEASEPVAAQNEIHVGANHPAQSDESGARDATGGAVSPGKTEGQGNTTAAANANTATSPGNRALLEAERLEAVARAAAIARAENKAYRSPASVVQSKVEDLLDTTLFQRISQTYRRKSAGMKTFDARSGDLIRSIEKPEIFRSL